MVILHTFQDLNIFIRRYVLLFLGEKVFDLTVYFGAPVAEPAPLGLPSLEQAVVNVPDELLQLRVGRVHYLRPGFTQDPSGDPPLRGQGHDQEPHGADTEHRGHREGDPFPQRRHLTNPWCPQEGNTTPGSDRAARSAITMSLFYDLRNKNNNTGNGSSLGKY